MAYLPQTFEDEESVLPLVQQNGMPGQPTTLTQGTGIEAPGQSGIGMAGAPRVSGGTPQAPTRSGRITNFQRYVNALAPQAQQLAGRVATQEMREGEQAYQNRLGQAQQAFGQRVQAGIPQYDQQLVQGAVSGIAERGEMLSPEMEQRIRALQSAQYGGPRSFAEAGMRTGLERAAEAEQQKVQEAWSTEKARQQSLQELSRASQGGSRYTPGMSSLDQFLIQAAPGAQEEFTRRGEQLGSRLQQQLARAAEVARQSVGDVDQQAAAVRQQTQEALTGGLRGYEQALQQAGAQRSEGARKAIEGLYGPQDRTYTDEVGVEHTVTEDYIPTDADLQELGITREGYESLRRAVADAMAPDTIEGGMSPMNRAIQLVRAGGGLPNWRGGLGIPGWLPGYTAKKSDAELAAQINKMGGPEQFLRQSTEAMRSNVVTEMPQTQQVTDYIQRLVVPDQPTKQYGSMLSRLLGRYQEALQDPQYETVPVTRTTTTMSPYTGEPMVLPLSPATQEYDPDSGPRARGEPVRYNRPTIAAQSAADIPSLVDFERSFTSSGYRPELAQEYLRGTGARLTEEEARRANALAALAGVERQYDPQGLEFDIQRAYQRMLQEQESQVAQANAMKVAEQQRWQRALELARQYGQVSQQYYDARQAYQDYWDVA